MSQTLIGELVQVSGLSAGQVARLFGTVSRSVHGWAQGAVLPEHHQRRAEHLLATIRPLGDTPARRRQALLDSSAGPSPFRRLLDEVPGHQRIHHQVPVAELFGLGR